VAGAALRGRLRWLLAAVEDLTEQAPDVREIALRVAGWPGHLPGQHVDVRLTAEDGYQAQRSYSVASPSERDRLSLTVERIPDGEVSTYLTGELRPGDQFELRGPIGGYFVWTPDHAGPLLLVGAGSGIVPLMAIMRERARSGSPVPASLLLSARSWERVIYHDELQRLAAGDDRLSISFALTRSQPSGWSGYARRVDAAMLSEVAPPPPASPQCFVCGPTGFVESVASALVELGHRPGRVKTERFGPTGGDR